MWSNAVPPWTKQNRDAFGRVPKPGSFYFHRDKAGIEPPCTLCLTHEAPGHLVVRAIVPDAGTVSSIPHDQYLLILREFDEKIASPSVEKFDGMASIGTSTHTLEDYFSSKAITLLERFCTTSYGSGSDLGDQEKWIAFLLEVFRNGQYVHCDTFGACLEAKGWWQDDGIRDLVHEYDFAMRLLSQAKTSDDE